MAKVTPMPAGAHARLVAAMLALAAGGIVALSALVDGIRFRVPLAVLGGGWFWIGLAAAAFASATSAVALFRFARAWRRRSPAVSWLSLRALVATVILGGAAYLVLVPQFETPWISLFASGCLGLWAGFLILEERITLRAPGLVRRLDLILFELALILLLTEGSLRVLARVWPSPLLATPDAGAEETLEQYRQPAGVFHLSFPTNSRGHYDEEFTEKQPGERLVACIGDSFSFSAVPHYWHYTTICERLMPGTRVHNFSVPGIGPKEYEILLRTEALPLHPDLAVIAVFVGNDLFDPHSRDVRSGGVLRSWLGRGENRTWTLIDRLSRIRADRRDRDAGDLGSRADVGDDEVVRLDDPEDLERQHPWLHDPSREPAGMSERAYYMLESFRAREASMKSADSYAPFFRSMEAILRAAGEIPLGILLIPDQFQVDDDLWSRLQESLGPGEKDRDRPQRLIGRWLEERGVPFVDPLPRMRDVPLSPDGSRHLYVLRNTHLNVRGNEIAAACLVELIGRMQSRR